MVIGLTEENGFFCYPIEDLSFWFDIFCLFDEFYMLCYGWLWFSNIGLGEGKGTINKSLQLGWEGKEMCLELQADKKNMVKFWILKSWRVQLELLNLEGVAKVLKHTKNMIWSLFWLNLVKCSLVLKLGVYSFDKWRHKFGGCYNFLDGAIYLIYNVWSMWWSTTKA